MEDVWVKLPGDPEAAGTEAEAYVPHGIAPHPQLVGDRVVLRAPGIGDYDGLRALELAPALAWRWRHEGRTPSPDEWMAAIWRDVAAQYLVVDRHDGSWAGIVYAYNVSLRHGHGFLAAAKFNSADRSRRVLEGLGLSIDQVFSTWPLHKLYGEVPGYNLDQIGTMLRGLVEEEGRLTDHLWLDGRRWDLHILSLSRRRWDEGRDALMAMARAG